MQKGKLCNNLLQEIIFDSLKKNIKHDCVIRHSQIGEDCSILSLDKKFCVLSSDPITIDDNNIGELIVKINSNDLLTTGAQAIGLMLTILIPTNTEINKLKKIMDDIVLSANKFNLEILGGHTEVTDAVNKIIISATIIGQKNKITSKNISISNKILVTKWLGLEATFIIANKYKNHIKNKFGLEFLNRCLDLNKYLSIKTEALVCDNHCELITKMHDITEGGLLGALGEIFLSTDLGIKIFSDKLPILEETRILCQEFSLDPLKIISSGSLIIFCDRPDYLSKKIIEKDINTEIIGEIIPEHKICFENNEPIDFCHQDEIYKLD